jgi:hypothetical protein
MLDATLTASCESLLGYCTRNSFGADQLATVANTKLVATGNRQAELETDQPNDSKKVDQ